MNLCMSSAYGQTVLKIDALALTETKWDHIGIFCSLLRVRIKK